MSQEQKELQKEQERVDLLTEQIQHRIGSLQKHEKKVLTDALEIRKSFWDDVTVNLDEPDDIAETYSSIKQQAQLLLERERSKGQLEEQIKTLKRLKDSPYFGRVDFKEDGETDYESIYIGIRSFMDKDNENFLIYDWRAPISSIYYDYYPGSAKYKTPEGVIEGDMKLKRQFIIRNSNIEGMFDTGVTIGDQILQEVLGRNANTEMKSIVATIQKEQNQIIRNENSKLLIVQGVAGSGKTSAALQRVAYLLYRYRGTLTSQNIILFSPNPLFNSYVATVLPELGEENMQQTTLLEYLRHRIGSNLQVEDSFMQLEYLLSGEESNEYKQRQKSIHLKSSLSFKDIIDRYAQYLSTEGMKFKSIKLRKKVLIDREQIKEKFYSLDDHISIPNRIHLLQEWLFKELKRRKRIEKKRDWVKEEIQFLDKEDYVKAFKKLQEDERYVKTSFNDFDREEKLLAEILVSKYFKPLIRKVKDFEFINYLEIYDHLFNEDTFRKIEIGALEDWPQISRQTVKNLNSHQISYEDATPFVYLVDLIEGKKTHSGIKHIFIDEAQDYTPFQFAYLRHLFPNSKVTLLGDINQGIYSHSQAVESIFPDQLYEGEKEIISLTRSYRSTLPIVEFTRTILKDGDKIEPFNREGNKPTLTVVNSREILNFSIVGTVEELNHRGHESIAIICKTAKESVAVYSELKDRLPVRLIEKGTISFETGVIVIPSYLAKGIEFDAVIIYDASEKKYGKEKERKLFYTACTRAMHELHLFSVGKVSPFVEHGKKYIVVNR